MPRGGKGKMKTKQSSLQTAGLLPMLKKPAEAIGTYLHVPGAFWDKCPAADKEKIFQCLVRDFDALHKFAGGQAPSAAFEVQEMGEKGDGSLELGVASGEIFWMPYTPDFLKCYYNTFPDELPKLNDEQKTPVSIANKEPTQDDSGAPPCLPATLPARHHPGRQV